MSNGPIVRRISFDIHGEFITQLAREWFYTGEKSHEKVIEILMDSMTGTDTPEAQIRRYVVHCYVPPFNHPPQVFLCFLPSFDFFPDVHALRHLLFFSRFICFEMICTCCRAPLQSGAAEQNGFTPEKRATRKSLRF